MEDFTLSRPARRRNIGSTGPVYQVFEPMEATEPTLVQLFNYHNEQGKRLLAWTTLKHYYVTQRYLISFMLEKYGAADLLLTKIDYDFISCYEQFLYGLTPRDQRRPLQVNGVWKHLTRVKKMINLALNLDWLPKDPWKGFKMRHMIVERSFLNRLELKRLREAELSGRRLQVVRDLFVFSCYTGLAFVDMAGLRREHVVRGLDDGLWIKSFRQKTKTPVKTPLLPVAVEIFERYTEGRPLFFHGFRIRR